MPIILSQVEAKKDELDPKFFSKDFTGNGKRKSGLLNSNTDPDHNKDVPEKSGLMVERKMEEVSGAIVTKTYPVAVPSASVYNTLKPDEPYDLNDIGTLKLVSLQASDGLSVSVIAALDVVQIAEIINKKEKNSKHVVPRYNVRLMFVRENRETNSIEDGSISDTARGTVSQIDEDTLRDALSSAIAPADVLVDKTTNGDIEIVRAGVTNPYRTMLSLLHALRLDTTIYSSLIDDWLDDVHLADLLTQAADRWSNKPNIYIDNICAAALRAYKDGRLQPYKLTRYTNNLGLTRNNESLWTLLNRQMLHLMDFPIGLKSYEAIWSSLQKHFDTHIFGEKTKDYERISNSNLNLMFNCRLEDLDRVKSTLSKVPGPGKAPLPDWLNPQQRAAIESDSSLSLVNSGAGTGKSSTINALINYYIDAGIEPHDITAISFTNAAADHLKDLQPELHSFTIAAMIHEIYKVNFPKQQLSNMATLTHTIRAYHGSDPFAQRFVTLLEQMEDDESNLQAKTMLNNFIEVNFKQVVSLLDSVGQTALGLETIVLYQYIDNMQEPPEVTSKHLIIDEVQDNSIFEFIFVLRYIRKNLESLFIVGDASQTLYEFRASNPKALNMLEASGIFKNFRLETNYRSNQEILNYANEQLKDIEANQYAQLQLESATDKNTSMDSFIQKVRFAYQPTKTNLLPTKASLTEQMAPLFSTLGIFDYIESCMRKVRPNSTRHQQVAVLAYQRKVANAAEDMLRHRYPDKKIVQLTSTRPFVSAIFSTYIQEYGREISQIPAKNIAQILDNQIMHRLASLMPRGDIDTLKYNTRQMLDRWHEAQDGLIMAQYAQLAAGAIDHQTFVERIKKLLLDFEIQDNAARAKYLSMSNEEKKAGEEAKNADIIVSTIHGVKGLEFDNTVVFVEESLKSMSEDKKRLYYVALTRAIESEFVLAYGSDEFSQMEAYWNTLVVDHFERDFKAGRTTPEALIRVWNSRHSANPMPPMFAQAIADARSGKLLMED